MTVEEKTDAYHLEFSDKPKDLTQSEETLHEVLKKNRPSLMGKGMMKLYLVYFLMYFNSTCVGYDGSLMGSINALEEYLQYYNLKQASAGTGLIFSIFNIGSIAAISIIWLNDYIGRKYCVVIGCIGVCVGTVITATAKTIPVLIGGRFFMSYFMSLSSVAAPMYCVELSPPHLRGVMAGLYNTLWYCGSLIAAFSCYGALIHYRGTLLTFRLPLWLQMVCPAIVLCGVWFVPESPRFLVGTGKIEEARKIIVKYHCNGDESHPMADLEMFEIRESLREIELASIKSLFDYRDLFARKSDRRRLLLIVAFGWFQQFSGNNIISYYLVILLVSIGVTDAKTQILLNASYAIVGWVFAIVGSFLHDRVGRRRMFMGSISGLTLCLAVVAGCVAGFQHKKDKGIIDNSLSTTAIVFIFLFGAIFAIGFTAAQPIYPGECSSNKIRAKGMTVYVLVGGVSSFVNQYAAPVAMANIKYWFYVFFVFWDLIELLIVYLFFVETKGRTLEELDVIFESENPRKASMRSIGQAASVETNDKV